MQSQSIRIIGTLFIFFLISFIPIQYKFIAYTFTPFFTDLLDCDFIKILNPNFSCKTFEYQSSDKILDLLTYIIIIVLAKPFYSDFMFNVLIVLIIWRAIGVLKYSKYNDVKYLWKHIDAINITMIIAYLSSIYPDIKNNEKILIIIGIFFKSIYEKIHHKKNYNISL